MIFWDVFPDLSKQLLKLMPGAFKQITDHRSIDIDQLRVYFSAELWVWNSAYDDLLVC